MSLQSVKSSLVRYGEFPYRLFGIALVLRAMDLLLIQSSYVPDEYWQSLEVAHNKVFGYGHLTWEWTRGVRSYLYVTIISGAYWVLKVTSLDTPAAVVLVPRVLQAVSSALADVYFVRWVYEKRSGQYSWALISWLTSYFVSYCSTRTLVNTFEMNLTVIALYYFPWTPKTKNSLFVTLVSVLFFVRPTSAVIFAPLVLINILSSRTPLVYFLKSYVPVVAVVGALSVGIDSYLHGSLIVTPWEFFVSNIIDNIGQFYGTHDYFWYFYAGIPAVLGFQLLPFYYRVFTVLRNLKRMRRNLKSDVESQMVITVLWSVFVFSLVPHKEFRFLLPLMPMMVYLSSSVWSKWSVGAKTYTIYSVAFLLIVTNYCSLLFLGQFHKAGGLQAVKRLANDAVPDSSFLVLAPCHSLPLYSHVHANVSVRFLTCEPDFEARPDYKDEADEFYKNPVGWLKREYPPKSACSLPTHIVSYNSLNITNYLYINNFTLAQSYFDSYYFPERTGTHINVYQRKGKPCV